MAAEYLANAVQDVNLNAPIIFTASIPCNRGWVYHEDETGIFILRGITNGQGFATYQVVYNGNIGVEEDGEITVSLVSPDGTERTERTRCLPTAEGERILSIDLEPIRDAAGERQYRAKNALKRLLYRMLSQETGKRLPWGSLTGIRPTHIPKTFLAAGWEEDAILSELR